MRSPAQVIEHVRALVERDPSLQERLYQPDDPALFRALMLEVARDHGIVAADAEAAIAAGQQASVDADRDRLPPRGWLPAQARWRDRDLVLDWAYLGSRRLCEPFFEASMLRCRSKPFNRTFRYAAPIDALAGWLQANAGLAPTGFIFHMSRCGSTLVSQMLAAMPHTAVISEAGPIDAVVQARLTRPDLDLAQHAAWLRWIVGALGQARSGEERHLFIKLDSWHALALPLFRMAFPTVPWIFLYREPLDVLVSQLRRRGTHMVPGLIAWDAFGFEAPECAEEPEAYCAEVLKRICDGVLRDFAPDTALLVNYQELPAALWSAILPHFGVACGADDRAAMADVARYDAKSPERLFTDDTDSKRDAATDRIRAAAGRLGERYARLEASRLSR